MIAEGERCNASHSGLGYSRDAGADGCADLCRDNGDCEFFHFDPNDGECLSVFTTGPNCPEGFSPSNWYDFWAIDGGSFHNDTTPEVDVWGPEPTSGHVMVHEG